MDKPFAVTLGGTPVRPSVVEPMGMITSEEYERPLVQFPSAMMARNWRWPHFSPEEMACNGTGAIKVDPRFMDRLEELRALFGRPMPVSSGYRSPEFNDSVSTTGLNGPHTSGRAVDIKVFGGDYFRLLQFAMVMGFFTGIGIRQHGPYASRFLHLDDLPNAPNCPRPWGWTYRY